MKNNKKVLLTGAALAALSPLAMNDAKAADTQAISMNAVIVQAIALSEAQTLHFGTFSITAAGTIAIDTAGADTGGGYADVGGAANRQEGIVNVKAAAGFAIDLTIGGADSVTGPGPAMVVNAFNIETAAGGSAQTVTLTAGQVAGGLSVPIGATLNFAAAGVQTPGTYTGSFDITATYQ